jgi:peptidoglycan/xylan/chitin deacetylase (PgdA/CDA1 family)
MINRFINKFKRTIIHTIYNIGFPQYLINPNKFSNKVIMYHGIDLHENKTYNHRFIGVKNFRKQLIYLKKNTNIISLTDYFQGNFKPGISNVAITFDDGYLNNYTYALPIIEELEIPVTIYVTALNKTEYSILWPDFVDLHTPKIKGQLKISDDIFVNQSKKLINITTKKTLTQQIKDHGGFAYKELVFKSIKEHLNGDIVLEEDLQDYWKLMTDKQICAIDKSKFVEIGSHAFLHNNLGNISLDEAKEELIVSKHYLETLLQREVFHLAYPDGSYTRELIDFAESIGFTYQVAAEYYLFPEKDISDTRILDRIGFYPSNSWGCQLDLLFKNSNKYAKS